MGWLRPLFIVNLVIASAVCIVLPMLLLVGVGSTARMSLLGVGIFYVLASIWLVICGKKNRLTAGVVATIFLAFLITGTWVSRNDSKRMADECTYFRTQCTKVDVQGVYYCGASEAAAGIGTVTHLEPECMPSTEQSCAYAKRFCKLISPPDSALTHYRCGHDTLTCP